MTESTTQERPQPGRRERLYQRHRAAIRIAVINAVLFISGSVGTFFALRSPAGETVALIAAFAVLALGVVSVTFIILTARSQGRDMPRDLFDALTTGPLGLFQADDDGNVTFVNATLSGWLDYDIDSLQVRRALTRALARHANSRKEASDRTDEPFAVRNADGSLNRLALVLHEIDGGGCFGAVWPEAPMGASRREEVEDLAAGWVGLLEGAAVGVAQVDPAGRVMTANRSFRRLMRLQGQVRQSRFLADVVAPEDRRSLIRRLADAGQGGEVNEPFEVRLAGEDEHAVTLFISGLKRTGEAAQGSIIHAADATPRRALEAQFEQSQKLHAVGQLAGGVAHDFNNILTAITGFCDLLLQRHPPGDPSFGEIMQIKQDAARAASLVRQLLTFSRRQRPRPRVLALSTVVSELMHLLRRLIGEQITLEVRHEDGQGHVRIDQGQLEQIVTNLVLNGRDAMPQGGTIRIVTFGEDRDVAFDAVNGIAPAGDYAVLEVADEGTGMASDVLEQIFEPFFTTKEVGRGTGLGLATVYGTVEQNDGFIVVESKPGQGTTFRIMLPRLNRTEFAAWGEAAEEARASAPMAASILLVEDEMAVRTFAASALRGRGYDVAVAEDPEAALDLLSDAEAPFDLLVTDVVMPGMSGPELARQVRQAHPDMAVIFISGYSEDAAGAEDIDSADFLPKPFGLKQLGDKVGAVLARSERSG